MDSTSTISVSEEIDDAKIQNGNLPSLRNTLLKPRNLTIMLVISVILNIILLCTSITATIRDNDTPSITPIPTRPSQSTAPSATSRPTAGPSQTPEQNLNSLQTCFRNCNTEDLLNQVRSEALKVTDIKAQINYVDIDNKDCYGSYLVTKTPDLESNTYSYYKCEDGFASTPPSDTIHIADDLYTRNSSGNWNLQSEPRISQIKLIRVIDDIKAQQTRTSDAFTPGTKYKTITGTGNIINSLGQLVNKTVIITINDYLEVVSYSVNIENISKESGYFFGKNETNKIEKPV